MSKGNSKVRRGFLSEADRNYIETHRDKKTPEQMAAHLRRAPGQVQNYVDEIGGQSPTKQHLLADEIERRPEWEQFRAQFDEDELRFFKYRYVALMGQFGREDTLPTEEMQIFQVITIEILTQRTLKEQKVIKDAMDAASSELNRLQEEFAETGDKAILPEIHAVEGAFNDARKSVALLTNRWEAYQGRQSAMLRELKGTRDQRVKIFEGSRQSFLGLLKALQAEDFRAKAGRDAALMKAAMDKERARVARPYRFGDGSVDQPLLTPATVLASYEGHAIANETDKGEPGRG